MAPFKFPHQKPVSIYFTPSTCQISRPCTPSFVSNKNHASLHYATFSSLLLLPPSDADDDNDDKRGLVKWCYNQVPLLYLQCYNAIIRMFRTPGEKHSVHVRKTNISPLYLAVKSLSQFPSYWPKRLAVCTPWRRMGEKSCSSIHS